MWAPALSRAKHSTNEPWVHKGEPRKMKLSLPKGAPSGADPIIDILRQYKTIAVVGLSSDQMRPSHGVAAYLQSVGYRIIPVNPNETKVLGEKSYARLEDVSEKIEIVDIFRRPEEVSAAVEGAIRVGAKVVWMQLGVINEPAAEKARAAGLTVVMDACLLVEHKRRRVQLAAR
jgi:predicted CoA-binding protein